MSVRLVSVLVMVLAFSGQAQVPANEEPFTHSLRWKQMNKPVHSSQIVADMEDKKGWSIFGVGEVGFTSERAIDGTTSLRYRTPTPDWTHIKADAAEHGAYRGGSGKGSHAILTFDEPQDWSDFNRISMWVYVHPDAVGYNTFYVGFHCLGAPPSDVVASWGLDTGTSSARDSTTTHAITVIHNLTPGQWNRVTWEIAPLQRDRVKYFYFYQRLRGPGRPGESWGTYDIDRIELELVDAEKYAGWETDSGTVAFCHVGYAPGAAKTAIGNAPDSKLFQVLDANTGDVVLTKPVEQQENRRGRFAVMDFSELNKPGDYLLSLGNAATRRFAINDNVWTEPVEKALNFFRTERCGFEVPGVHGVCHQDRFGVHGGTPRVINGGWHDAGDQTQGFWQTAMSVRAMLDIVEQLTLLDSKPQLREAMTEEAAWGLEWLLKTRFGDGYRISFTVTRIYTDSIIGTEDDIATEVVRATATNFICAAIEARAARVLSECKPDLARTSRVAAIEDWEAAVRQLAGDNPGTAGTPVETTVPNVTSLSTLDIAWGVLASVELFELTNERHYTDLAVAYARELAACQETEFVAGIPLTGYFYTGPQRERIKYFKNAAFEEVPLLALDRLCCLLPDHPDWMNWYKAIVLHSEYFLERGTKWTEPFAMLAAGVYRESDFSVLESGPKRESALAQMRKGTELADGYYLHAFRVWDEQLFHGSTGVQLSMTRALLAAAAARNDPDAQDLAMRQIEWIFGLNPFSKALMYGAGYDYAPLYSPSAGDIVGALPVGIDSLANDEPWWYDSNYTTFKEVWVVATHKFLSCMAKLAWPARVTVVVPEDWPEPVTLRQTTLGHRTVRTGLPVALPAGTYEISTADASYSATILWGGDYIFPAPAGTWVQLGSMEGNSQGGKVTLAVTAKGDGEHEFELRIYNGRPSTTLRKIRLTAGLDQQVRWEFEVANPKSPWVAVVVPDRDMNRKAEAHGTL